MSTSQGMTGGPAAIRGYLVQTLVALFDIAEKEPVFTEITLEPVHAHDQFDFIWSNSDGQFAVQVKSTVNEFKKSDVELWAKKLRKVRKNESCRLILIGNCHSNMARVNNIEDVAIERRSLDLKGLFEQAAHKISKFMHAQRLDPCTPGELEIIARFLVSHLLELSVTQQSFTHDEFVKLLAEWVRAAPAGKLMVDISRIDKYAPVELIGREVETGILSNAWDKALRGDMERPRVLAFIGLGGEGKTSLVSKWALDLAHNDWPGCDGAFAWSFYSQGMGEQSASSSDLFLNEGLRFFGDEGAANSNLNAFDKGQRLAELLSVRRALLILDGLEPLQSLPVSPTFGELSDKGLSAMLRRLASVNKGLCVLTSRYSIPDLNGYRNGSAPEINLLRLSKNAGVKLLMALGVRKESGASLDFEKLVERVKGHALTLRASKNSLTHYEAVSSKSSRSRAS